MLFALVLTEAQTVSQEKADGAKQKLLVLQKQLPGVLKQAGWVDDIHKEERDGKVGTLWTEQIEIKRVTRITPTTGKIVIYRHYIEPDRHEHDSHDFLIIYLGFCDGRWTTSSFEGIGRFDKGGIYVGAVRALMLAIDEICHGEKP